MAYLDSQAQSFQLHTTLGSLSMACPFGQTISVIVTGQAILNKCSAMKCMLAYLKVNSVTETLAKWHLMKSLISSKVNVQGDTELTATLWCAWNASVNKSKRLHCNSPHIGATIDQTCSHGRWSQRVKPPSQYWELRTHKPNYIGTNRNHW